MVVFYFDLGDLGDFCSAIELLDAFDPSDLGDNDLFGDLVSIMFGVKLLVCFGDLASLDKTLLFSLIDDLSDLVSLLLIGLGDLVFSFVDDFGDLVSLLLICLGDLVFSFKDDFGDLVSLLLIGLGDFVSVFFSAT